MLLSATWQCYSNSLVMLTHILQFNFFPLLDRIFPYLLRKFGRLASICNVYAGVCMCACFQGYLNKRHMFALAVPAAATTTVAAAVSRPVAPPALCLCLRVRVCLRALVGRRPLLRRRQRQRRGTTSLPASLRCVRVVSAGGERAWRARVILWAGRLFGFLAGDCREGGGVGEGGRCCCIGDGGGGDGLCAAVGAVAAFLSASPSGRVACARDSAIRVVILKHLLLKQAYPV